MEKKIYKEITNKDFYDILANTDELNKIILSNLYTSIYGFIILSQKSEINSNLIDLLKKYESEAYVAKNRILTDKEIINLELARIAKEYKKQLSNNILNRNKTINDITLDDIDKNQELLILVEYYLGQIKIFKELSESDYTQENIDFIKMKIAYIEALLKMKNGLYYESYLNFCEELERVLELNNQKELEYKIQNSDIYYKKR